MLFGIQFADQAWTALMVESRVAGLVVWGSDLPQRTEVAQMVAPLPECQVRC